MNSPQNDLHKQKIRNYLKQFLAISLPVFSALFLIGTTAIIIAVMNGYSIDINKRIVIQTGVLNIETNPTEADITVNGAYYGKSNKAIPNLQIGTYTVKVSKDGYFPYTRSVEIQHGLASPVSVPLLRTDGQKQILEPDKTALVDYNNTGYYVLTTAASAAKIGAVTGTGSLTPTPTPTVKPKADTTLSYVITRAYITKPLFDDPRSALDETMTIKTLSSDPITGFSISPTGKLVYLTLTDKSGAKSISIVPFKKGSTIDANLTDSKSLTNYVKAKGTTLDWSKDGDYIIVDTAEQIISYNVKTGTRIILVEKSEVGTGKEALVWNLTDTGIVLIRKSQGTITNSYEISDITYNGNPVSTQLPIVPFDSAPTHIWSYSETDIPRYVVSTTASGSYLVGKLYDPKSSDYEITTGSSVVDSVPLTNFGNDFSKLEISTEELTLAPIHYATKYMVAFTENKNQRLVLFIYNKRVADTLTVLGRHVLQDATSAYSQPTFIATGSYISVLSGNSLIALDTVAQNIYTLQTNVQNYTLGLSDMGILFTNDANTLFFRVLR